MKNDETIVVKRSSLIDIFSCIDKISKALDKLEKIQDKEGNDFEIGFIAGSVKREILTAVDEIEEILEYADEGNEPTKEPILEYAIDLSVYSVGELKYVSKKIKNDISRGFYLGKIHQILNESVGVLKEYDKSK
ncbi:hypothetical protein J5300_07310 [Riemerella anatipestifer]|uniref:hypothetical protein n=1 Tax=Riemerella anatipestifer TaxID=34085 RepID=UPI001BDA9DF0|nr:hypothetical protein [Riemerella anatipestifer]MBT0534110.1 hypothetical protein [Riemerella anatipestifer]MBT0540049.1 hypothetical protein [Riemerella anatipestifer]MBT0543910.1 hypothetical protein [Riemerella anatipestifer]MBT0545877.1 hypothetical protein [Riemerella anatipestifer]MBT0547813.1 hypothetical protein [Riemerella anatipestifer]